MFRFILWGATLCFASIGFAQEKPIYKNADELSKSSATFKFDDIKKSVLKLTSTAMPGANGTGFLISSDGYFVTTYHGMDLCIGDRKDSSEFQKPIDCSPKGYKATLGEQEYSFQIISHLSAAESRTPDMFQVMEAVSKRDFLVAKLQGVQGSLPYLELAPDFRKVNLEIASAPVAVEPIRAFIPGYPLHLGFVITPVIMTFTDQRNTVFMVLDNAFVPKADWDRLAKVGLTPDIPQMGKTGPGASGAGVVNETGQVVGILSGGSVASMIIHSTANLLDAFFTDQVAAKSETTFKVGDRVYILKN